MDGGGQRLEGWLQKIFFVIAILAMIVLAAVGVYAVGDAIFAPTPIKKSPGFVETVLASRSVVAAVRIAVIAAAAFIVVSVVALISKGQWPTRIGPVHIADEAVSNLDAENEQLRTSLANARETIDNLKGDLAASNRLLDRLDAE